MTTKIALAGNPNCGKTSIFNALTGSSQYVGNWPGVTVEKKEGKLKNHRDCVLVDLPGIYSLSPYTLEEVVTRDFLIGEKPDVLINIIDAANLERNLYLTTQLLEVGIPVVIALNMIDVVQKNGDKINTAKLSEELGVPIIETSATKGTGLKELATKAIEMSNQKTPAIPRKFSAEVEKPLEEIAELLKDSVSREHLRWYSIKWFERDEKIITGVNLSSENKAKIENIVQEAERIWTMTPKVSLLTVVMTI